jgi:PKD repeat protein
MKESALRTLRSRLGRSVAGVTAASMASLGLFGLVAVAAPAAHADTAPAAGTPATVSADSLPTWQINGVVWSSVTVGNTVYATGSFTQARPPGVAVGGTGSVARSNLLAYDITTGNLITSFNHTLSAQGRRIAASPDGSRVYVGGDFTTVDGQTRNHIAAFNTATGALDPNFKPSVNNIVNAISVAQNGTVYMGGSFTFVNGLARTRLAAVSAAGVLSTTWTPTADDETVFALVVAPDQSRVIVGGKFSSLDGQPYVGVGSVDATSGALMPWAYQPFVARNGGGYSYVTDLTTDGSVIYASDDGEGGGYFDGRWAANPSDGSLVWQDTCFGASYGVYATGGVLYSVGHAHNCSAINGFPQTDPWTWHRALAETTAWSGLYDQTNQCANCTTSNYGKPIPTPLDWYPTVNTGTYTGQSQGGWTISGNSTYVAMSGEFTQVNGKAQQGLARFAVSSAAPNKMGPQVTSTITPSIVSLTAGTARLSWQTQWDMDNESLTYNVMRYGKTTPVYTTTVKSTFWNKPYIGFTDTGLTPGATYKYYVQVVDPFGNLVNSGTVSIVASSATTTTSQYAKDVANDGAIDYWRLNQATGATTSYDYVGYNDISVNGGVSGGASGAINGDADTASNFDGSNAGFAATNSPIPGPNVFTEEVWFKTTSTQGGKILGFGDQNTGNSSNYDRHIYMDGSGAVYFGVYNNNSYTVQTGPGYNDGQWHQAVGTMSPSGIVFYVDGKRIGSNGGTSVAQPYNGYWRIGGDSPWTGAAYFQGSIDDVSIYPTALSLTQVRQHFLDSGRTIVGATAPADTYGATVWNDSPNVYWRLDETSGTKATDISGNGADGTYNSGVTLGTASPVASTGKAATFDGNGGLLASNTATQAPTVYSEELWFKTTTNNGGKLIGFGCNNTGLSGCYDRHVYMENSGQLTFGTWTGFTNTITSPAAYNDGNWHYLVATQGSDGMKLYVDNQLVGTNPQTGAQDYAGYWRVGGDNTWGPQPWFAGTIDEVAVYPTVLTPTQIAAHYGASSAINHAPTASFTKNSTNLTVNVDGSASSDPDGPIASYSWNWGDGTPNGSGATATHTYANAGPYTITLTVSDGTLTSTAVQNVTVQAANVPPTASFIHSESAATTNVDATASTDTDGTIASYSWNWGDGTPNGAGVTTSHIYGASGNYTVTLTVTDNSGATNSTTASVTVTVPNQLPTAAFTHGETNLTVNVNGSTSSDPDGTIASYSWNWGDNTPAGSGATATHTYATGGPYTITLTVTDNRGGTNSTTADITVVAANVAPTASFTHSENNLAVSVNGAASNDPDGTIASYSWNWGDNTPADSSVTANHTYAAGGTYTVTLTVTDNRGGTGTATATFAVVAPGAVVLASDDFNRTVANGFGTTTPGGAWTPTTTATSFAVSGGSAKVTLKAAGSGPQIFLNAISSTTTDTEVSMTTDKAGTGTNGIDLSLVGRRVGTSDYNAKVRLLPTGAVRLGIYKTDSAGTQTAVVAETVIAGLTYTPGDVLTVRFMVTGTSPTTLKAKVWKSTGTEPTAWQASGTDTTAALQSAGSVGLKPYLSGSATNAPVLVTYTQFRAWDASTE